MVLAELGGRITRALQQMTNATVIDDKVLTDCLNEITRALMQADVNFEMVRTMTDKIKKIVNLKELAAGHNKRRIIQQAVTKELCSMLDPGKPAFTPKKGKLNIIMFIGLQGAGKTTTCTKYAYYYQKKGWKPGLLCADTFRAGAFDQLKQNASKANIPFYGSYTVTDPVTIAQEGMERLKLEKCDLIIMDTSGRHRQEAALFEEMRQLSEAVQPDLVVFTMDSSMGQAAFDQAQAFKQSVAVGAVIVTKMDGHARGGGALSAVAATKSPIIFLGTGEHMDDLEQFEPKPFVQRLLGMGDLSGLVNKVHEAMPVEQQEELMEKLMSGTVTLRLMYELFQHIVSMGSLSSLMTMMPGFDAELMPKGQEKETQKKYKIYMVMMDSMTNKELDNPNPLKVLTDGSRMMRVPRGSGRSLQEVNDLRDFFVKLSKLFTMKRKGSKRPRIGDMTSMARNMNPQQLSRVVPPQMLQQLGGVGGLQNLIKNIGGPGTGGKGK